MNKALLVVRVDYSGFCPPPTVCSTQQNKAFNGESMSIYN